MRRFAWFGFLLCVCLGHAAAAPAGLAVDTAALPTRRSLWERAPWSDPGFFPIAVWLQDPARAEAYQRAGFNTYVGLWNGPTEAQLGALRKAGLRVICDQNAVGLQHRDDPTILAWMHGDEPDNAQSLGEGKGYGPPIPPGSIVADYERLRRADPTRPVLLNLGQGVAWDNYYGRGVRTRHPEDYAEYAKGCDIASFDIYPAVHEHPEVAGKLWYVARGVERLSQWIQEDQRVWNCLECTRIGNPDRKPTPREVRAEAWSSLIQGSRGLIYFVHQFKPVFREAALLDDPEMLAAVTSLNHQIATLAPVLNRPASNAGVTVRSSNDSVPLLWTSRQFDGGLYVFVAGMREGDTTATIALTGRPGCGQVEVLGEGRMLSSTNGVFADSFGPWDVHLYRVAPGPSTLQPVDLRCEYATDPSGVDAVRPRLSWALESTARGAGQSAYRILAATSIESLDSATPDLWDSGKVPSDRTLGIEYSGVAFRSSQTVHWKVQVWDREGRGSAWSQPAAWIAGVLAPGDWQARWIACAPSTAPPKGLPLLRKRFDTTRAVRRAVVHVSGLGHYDLFLDGAKVGDRFLDPAWSMYERTVYYTTFDVTEKLRSPGPHSFGVMLGKGFYNTAGDRRVHGVEANRPLKLILQAELTFEGGARELVVSDASWRTTEGPITHSAILGGEDYDARRLPTGWADASFDDSPWARAVECEGPGGTLRSSLGPPMTAHEVFAAKGIDEPAPGVFVYDFGQNASAVPRLRVRGRAGQSVRIVTAEQREGMSPRRNDGRGKVDQAGVGKPHFSTYTLRGGETETWTPQFYYTGFQFAQVEGAVPVGHPNPQGAPVVEELASVHVRNAARPAGRFECSNPLFNTIDRTIDWAVRSNLGHVLTDCPHREKLGWLEVAYLMGPSIAARYDIDRFYAKVARDCIDSQRSDGWMPTVAPAYPKFEGGFAYTPEWGAAMVLVPWLAFEWYGDDQLLAEAYPAMRAFVDYLERSATDLVPAPGLGDWYDYGHGEPAGPSRFTPPELSAMATFRRCAVKVAATAERLGRADDAARYARLAQQITESFNRHWFDGRQDYRNSGSPQTANAMALVTGMVPADRREAVLTRVIEDLRQRGNQQTSGDIGHAYLLQALAEGGRSDVIFDLTARTNLGSYGFIVGNGWTSLPEAWDANTGASMNHCMLGHIQEWFVGWVAGIRPDASAPGFRRFIIDPNPTGDLTWARADYDSVRGRIVSHWRRENGRFTLQVTLPPNTEAQVSIPALDPASILEGSRPATEATGVRFLRKDGSRVWFGVASGAYVFDAPL